MPNNITTTLTPCLYAQANVGRLKGTLQAGEVDLTTTFTSSNTDIIYGIDTGGQLSSWVPGNALSVIETLEPGKFYLIKGKSAFEVPFLLPSNNTAKQTEAVRRFQAILGYVPTVALNTTIDSNATPTSGVTLSMATEAAPRSNIKYDSIANASGFPVTIALRLAGTAIATISFPSAYLEKPFNFTYKANSQTYFKYFVATDIDLDA